MARVTGIGGVFFRARDPAVLNTWYRQHLGVTQPNLAVWMQEAGPTVFSPFAASADYFAADRQWMLNLRFDDLPGLIARLRALGVAVETRADWDGDGSYGTFSRITTPKAPRSNFGSPRPDGALP